MRQCLLYASSTPNARLIGTSVTWQLLRKGVEYMISNKLFRTLEPEEQKLWHSHVYEVKSGMLFMPKPALVPESAWLTAETKAMEEIITLYGKTYHFWEVDRGDTLPLGISALGSNKWRQEHQGWWWALRHMDKLILRCATSCNWTLMELVLTHGRNGGNTFMNQKYILVGTTRYAANNRRRRRKQKMTWKGQMISFVSSNGAQVWSWPFFLRRGTIKRINSYF